MKNAIIISIENNPGETNYEKLAIVLCKSIRQFNKSIKIFCGIFTNRLPATSTINILKQLDVTIIQEQMFICSTEINYFLRNYTMHYFSNIINLTEKYNLLYIDIDVICLDDPEKIFTKYGNGKLPIVQKVPKFIINMHEEKYIGKVDTELYFNWFQIITADTQWLYDIDYLIYKDNKQSDIEISKRISNKYIESLEAIIPTRVPSNETILFHYDSFDSFDNENPGTFLYLKSSHPQIFLKYKNIAKILGFQIQDSFNHYSDMEKAYAKRISNLK